MRLYAGHLLLSWFGLFHGPFSLDSIAQCRIQGSRPVAMIREQATIYQTGDVVGNKKHSVKLRGGPLKRA